MPRRIELEITPGACILWALMLLVLPLRWLLGAAVAAMVHEVWHLAAIFLCGGEVYRIRIGAGGAVMETQPLDRWQELICAAAGPAGSFSLLLAAKSIPATALCGFVQGLFNLIPLFPLDGGRLLRCGLALIFPKITPKVIRNVEMSVLLILLLAGIYAAVKLGMGLLLLIFLPAAAARLLPQKNTLQRFKTGGTIEKE